MSAIFTPLPDGQLRAQIDVLDVGNAPVVGPVTRNRIAGLDVTGTLYNTGVRWFDVGELESLDLASREYVTVFSHLGAAPR